MAMRSKRCLIEELLKWIENAFPGMIKRHGNLSDRNPFWDIPKRCLGLVKSMQSSGELSIDANVSPNTMKITKKGIIKWDLVHNLKWVDDATTCQYVLLKVYLAGDKSGNFPYCKLLLYPRDDIRTDDGDIFIGDMRFRRDGALWRTKVYDKEPPSETFWRTKFVHLYIDVDNKNTSTSNTYSQWMDEMDGMKFMELISPEYLTEDPPRSIYAAIGPKCSHERFYLYATHQDIDHYCTITSTERPDRLWDEEAKNPNRGLTVRKSGKNNAVKMCDLNRIKGSHGGNKRNKGDARDDRGNNNTQRKCDSLERPKKMRNRNVTSQKELQPNKGQDGCVSGTSPDQADVSAEKKFYLDMDYATKILCYDPWNRELAEDTRDCCRHIGLEALFCLCSSAKGVDQDGGVTCAREIALRMVLPLLRWAVRHVHGSVEQVPDDERLLDLLKPLHDRSETPVVRTLGDLLRAAYAQIDSPTSRQDDPIARKMTRYWRSLRSVMVRHDADGEDLLAAVARAEEEEAGAPTPPDSALRPPARDGGARPQWRPAGYYDPEHAPRSRLDSLGNELLRGEWWHFRPHFEPQAERVTLYDAVLALAIREDGSHAIETTLGDPMQNRISVRIRLDQSHPVRVESSQGRARRSTVVHRRPTGDRRPRCWIQTLNDTAQHTPPGDWYDHELARLHDHVADQMASFTEDTPVKDAGRWSLLSMLRNLRDDGTCAWTPAPKAPSEPCMPEIEPFPADEALQEIAKVSAALHEERQWPCRCSNHRDTGFYDMACKNAFGVWIVAPPCPPREARQHVEFLLGVTAPLECSRDAVEPIIRLGYCRVERESRGGGFDARVLFRRQDDVVQDAWTCHIFKRLVDKFCMPAVMEAALAWMADDSKLQEFQKFRRTVARALESRGK